MGNQCCSCVGQKEEEAKGEEPLKNKLDPNANSVNPLREVELRPGLEMSKKTNAEQKEENMDFHNDLNNEENSNSEINERAGKRRGSDSNGTEEIGYPKIKVNNEDEINRSNGNAPKSVWEAINLIKGKKLRSPLSNSKMLPQKVEDFMPEELLTTNDPNAVFMEGLLWRYQPGFSQHFFQKYCIITPQGFQYFNSPIESSSCLIKPLLFIPLKKIGSIMQVSVSIPEEKQIIAQYLRSPQNKSKSLILPKYQMELIIKGDANDITRNKTMDNRIENARALLTSSPQPLSRKILNGVPKLDENLFEFAQRNSKLCVADQLGHLMRSPSKCQTSRLKNIAEKTEYSTISWTKREIHWYYAEDRMLFATDSEQDMQKWILSINWVLAKNKQEQL